MPRSRPVDGFSLEYDRAGSGPPVILLHGWPGARSDQREVATGFECGIVLANYQDVKEGDVLETYETRKVERALS